MNIVKNQQFLTRNIIFSRLLVKWICKKEGNDSIKTEIRLTFWKKRQNKKNTRGNNARVFRQFFQSIFSNKITYIHIYYVDMVQYYILPSHLYQVRNMVCHHVCFQDCHIASFWCNFRSRTLDCKGNIQSMYPKFHPLKS